jgi:hypothetical protein
VKEEEDSDSERETLEQPRPSRTAMAGCTHSVGTTGVSGVSELCKNLNLEQRDYELMSKLMESCPQESSEALLTKFKLLKRIKHGQCSEESIYAMYQALDVIRNFLRRGASR